MTHRCHSLLAHERKLSSILIRPTSEEDASRDLFASAFLLRSFFRYYSMLLPFYLEFMVVIEVSF